MDQLKFVVLDEEDLEVVSTHLQDAVVKVSDVLWRPQEKRLVVALNRFDWEGAQTANKPDLPEYRRQRSALRLEVECLEGELADLGPSWTTTACPAHAVEGDSQPASGRR